MLFAAHYSISHSITNPGPWSETDKSGRSPPSYLILLSPSPQLSIAFALAHLATSTSSVQTHAREYPDSAERRITKESHNFYKMAATDAPVPTATADAGLGSVVVDCDSGNDYDGRMGLRISAVFVILIGSLLGTLLPIFLARSSRLRVPKLAFFIAKYFGSGVIVATAFIHLLAPANEALGSPCFPDDSAVTAYSWPEGICLMTIFVMFLIELVASRYDFNIQGVKAHDPAMDLIAGSKKEQDEEMTGKP